MSNTISELKQSDADMKRVLGAGGDTGNGGNAGMMSGMPQMPGMPSPEDMQRVFAYMQNNNMNPDDPQQFMQAMAMTSNQPQGGGNFNQPGGGGGGNFGQQGGGFGGPNQNRNSPHPQGNHGFQPPQGPMGQGDQNGFGGNMEGYSAQQREIMQGGGGRGRGRGRGRGYY